MRKIMDQVMEDLSEMEAIVIDVRFNGGGQDAVSFEILRHFNSSPTAIAQQKLFVNGSYTPTVKLTLDSAAMAYTRPVYVLTSQQTGSAAEAFAIATMAMKHVQRIGAPTAGAMSTALEKKLPNGWAFAISNEVYMDLEGRNYENKGIPVDYPLAYPEDRQTFFRAVKNDLDGDKRRILQAIEKLKDQ